jgi:hypothetical protein
VNFRILDLICKQASLRVSTKRILDQVWVENRSLTLNEEIQCDSMAAQLTELDAEIENRRIMERMLTEHVTHLLKQKETL